MARFFVSCYLGLIRARDEARKMTRSKGTGDRQPVVVLGFVVLASCCDSSGNPAAIAGTSIRWLAVSTILMVAGWLIETQWRRSLGLSAAHSSIGPVRI